MERKKQHQFLKGALVEMPVGQGGGTLQPIYFQFNPDTIERTKSGTWTSAQSQRQKAEDVAREREFKSLKGKKVKAGFVLSPEKISITLRLDSTEKVLRAPSSEQVDVSEGILPDLSALESLMKKARTDVSVGGTKNSPTLARTKEIPLVLFIWGNHRVIPVTLLSMTISEQKFDHLLNPIRAEVKVSIQVLEEEDSKLNDKAFRAYKFTEDEKERMKNRFLSTQKNANKGMPVQL